MVSSESFLVKSIPRHSVSLPKISSACSLFAYQEGLSFLSFQVTSRIKMPLFYYFYYKNTTWPSFVKCLNATCI